MKDFHRSIYWLNICVSRWPQTSCVCSPLI